ncbi:uncharacterized protein [Porites lutea]|uniref:uncharacterized protein isoform X1 n=1 Tax=Porites lutea TaxID=51062 RepID=UPI003CC572C8
MSKNEQSAYKLEWMDSYLHETLLPGSPWHKIREAINNSLATKVKSYCKNSPSEAIQPLLDLLGQQFVEKYLSYYKQGSVYPSTSSPSENRKEEAQKWLKTAIEESLSRLGLQWREDEASRDMLEFVGFAQQAVYRGMERELARAEKRHSQGQAHLSTSRRRAGLLCNSHQSKTLGKSVSALLKNHPSQLSQVCEQLHGRQLPNSLRPLIWSMQLQRKGLPVSGTQSSEDLEALMEEITTQFKVTLSWGLKELGVSNVMHSPIAGVIRHAVTEAYKYRPGLQSEVVSETHIKQAEEALNVLYIYNRSYEPQYALLVYPLVFAFQNEHLEFNLWFPVDRTDMSYKQAISLQLLLKNCFPTRLQIFSMADYVMQRLHHEDEQLFNHLISESRKNISPNPQEFLVNFIHTEKEQAMLAERQASGSSFKSLPSDAKELLFHPVMFIRKWIGEGFVGTLGVHAVMLVWDQCFMSNWQPSVMEHACLVLLQLLRGDILHTEGYSGIRRVLLDKPCELFTVDIQQGLSYLSNGGALLDVGSLRPPTQLPSLSEHEGVIPSPSPSVPDSHHSAVSRPVSRRTAALSTPMQTDPEELWVERTENSLAIEATTNREPFDVYIDEVRFIPDAATVVKVTGRILGPFWKKPSTLDVPDIEAFPLLESWARCPKFQFRYSVNVPAEGITGEAVLLLRIYTLDVNTGELLVVGNSVIRLFKENENDEWRLNAGGHQLPMKHLLPSTVAKLTEQAFDGITKVPVCSILIRLLPHSEEYVESPGYSSGYYFSEQCKPNDSEWRIFRRFKNHHVYPPTVREALRDIKEGEAEQEEGFDFTNDQAVTAWYQRRTSKHLLMRQPAKPMDLVKVVQYDQKQGLALTVEQAFGLPGNTSFVNVLVFVSPGQDVQRTEVTEEGHGGEEKALIKTRDFDSYQKSPKWIDSPTVFHPHISDLTTLVIRLCSLDAQYTPRADRTAPGSVTASRGRVMSVLPFGWTVLQLFSKEYVNAGVHYLPIFEGSPSPTFLEFLSSHTVDVSLKEAVNQRIHTLLGTSCVAVCLWDAHYSQEDCIPLPVNEQRLSVGKLERYKKTIQAASAGKLISDVVLQTLNKAERKQGMTGDAYLREEQHYEEAMNSVFHNLMDDVLLESGMGPMM